jgi:hypothetical protein
MWKLLRKENATAKEKRYYLLHLICLGLCGSIIGVVHSLGLLISLRGDAASIAKGAGLMALAAAIGKSTFVFRTPPFRSASTKFMRFLLKKRKKKLARKLSLAGKLAHDFLRPAKTKEAWLFAQIWFYAFMLACGVLTFLQGGAP